MKELLFKKVVDQSLLNTGATIPKDIQSKLLSSIGVALTKGEKHSIWIQIGKSKYEATITNVDFSEGVTDREVVQIRYSSGSSICQKLNELFVHSATLISALKSSGQKTIRIPDNNKEYIEVYPIGPETLEFRCYPKEKSQMKEKEDFFKYLGSEQDLTGYQRSYKLVFYKCFFSLLKDGKHVSADTLSQAFRNFYIARKAARQVADIDADPVITNIETSSIQSIYGLILRNPFSAINKKGYIVQEKINGKDYFSLNPKLQEELQETDIDRIISLIDRKIEFYFSRLTVTNGQIRGIASKILNEYIHAKNEPFSGHGIGNYMRNEVPNLIYQTNLVDPSTYLVSGSVGQGNWATIPWICIFDRNITTSATKGIYIVYLFSKDCNTLYLTFNQGCTDLRKTLSKRDAIRVMRENAQKIRSQIDSRGFFIDENIYLGDDLTELAEMYQKGTIFYKKYQKQNLPSEEIFRKDLSNMMDIYREYTNLYCGQDLEESDASPRAWLLTWNPSNWEWKDYREAIFLTHTGKKYVNEWSCVNTHVKIGDRVFLAMLGTKNNGIIASGHAITEGHPSKHWDPTKATNGQLINRIGVEFDLVLDINNEHFLQMDQLVEHFPNQKWNPQGSGISIKNYYVDELEKLWQSIHATGDSEMEIKEIISSINNYILQKGFRYEDGLIENFYLSLKSKPFVILAGTSGTGKTRLVKLFAEAVGATTENGRYKMVPVRPDWSDSSDLFGHVDLNGNFVPGAIIDFVKRAELDSNYPYFLCLDEMNLARVEYYLSDILSVIETRDFKDGRIQSSPLIDHTYYGADTAAAGRYGTVLLPENLYIIGTVNMDETTFPFSRKVLDRANTIEFSFVDLMPNFETISQNSPQALNLNNTFLKTEFLLLSQCSGESEAVSSYCLELQKINTILQQANAHVGYRVRDEIVFYLLNNKKYGLLPEDQAMDNELMQKILPRIQGSSLSVKNMLCELFKLCAGDYDGYQVQNDNVSDKMSKALRDTNRKIKYRHSAEKIELMIRRFEEDGFTSYWL